MTHYYVSYYRSAFYLIKKKFRATIEFCFTSKSLVLFLHKSCTIFLSSYINKALTVTELI